MVDQAPVEPYGASRRRSHAFALFCLCGGFVVLCWLAMTGTAQAAPNTDPHAGQGHAPGLGRLADAVTHHAQVPGTKPLHAAVSRTVHRAAQTVRHTRTDATQVVEHVTSVQPRQSVEQATKHLGGAVVGTVAAALPGNTGADHAVRHQRTHHASPNPRTPHSRPSASGAPTDGTWVAPATTNGHAAGGAADSPVVPFRVDQPAPESSGSNSDSQGGSSGSGALVEHSNHLPRPAGAARDSGTAPERPREPAYPPGSSPD